VNYVVRLEANYLRSLTKGPVTEFLISG